MADLLQSRLELVSLFDEIFKFALVDFLLPVSKLSKSNLAYICWTSIAFHAALDDSFLWSAYQRVIALMKCVSTIFEIFLIELNYEIADIITHAL